MFWGLLKAYALHKWSLVSFRQGSNVIGTAEKRVPSIIKMLGLRAAAQNTDLVGQGNMHIIRLGPRLGYRVRQVLRQRRDTWYCAIGIQLVCVALPSSTAAEERKASLPKYAPL